MMENKKSDRPGAPTPGRPEGSGACEASSDPTIQFTTTMPLGQAVHIADFLSHGADHGVHLSDLVRLTGLPERTVRLMIRAERLQGTPILENSRDGYFMPSNDHERARCVRSMRRRAAEIVKVADAIERAESKVIAFGRI